MDNIKESQFKNYLELLKLKGRSKATISTYALDLKNFFQFTNFQGQRITSPEEMILQYIEYLSHNRKNSKATICKKLSSLRMYFEYLVKRKIIHENPMVNIERPQKDKMLPKYLTLDQSQILLHVISGKHQIRDYCILTLLLNCGLRLSELTGLNLDDISSLDSPGQAFMRVWGKGSKERILFLNSVCVQTIREYIPTRKAKEPEETALFLNAFGRRIGNRTVQNMVRGYLQQIGLGKGYSVHTLRHTAATLLYQYAHADILVLQNILGHANLSTTQIYTHLGSHQIRKVLEASPLIPTKINYE